MAKSMASRSTQPKSGLRIEVVPIAKIQPAKYNPRKDLQPGDPEYEKLRRSIERWDLVEPLVWNERTGNLVGGHQRFKILLARGDASVPVSVVDLSQQDEAALNVALNKIGGEWDTPKLADLLSELDAHGFDATLTGFDVAELEELLGTASVGSDPEPQIDRASELREKWGTERGQIWEIPSATVKGKAHGVMCGDSTSAEDVGALLDGANIGVCFTSPPYAQQRQYGEEASELVKDWLGLMCRAFANVPQTDTIQVLVNLGLVHKDGEWLPYWDPWIEWMRERGWRRFGWYVWDKISATFKANDGRLWVSHEWIFHFNRRGVACEEWVACKHAGEMRVGLGQRKPDGRVAPLHTPGPIKSHRPPDSVVRVQRETDNSDPNVRQHPARYPVALPGYMLKTWPGDIYDPFLGSGTTAVAAENERRLCYGMEIDPGYVAVILQRLTDMGLTPALLETAHA